MAKSYFHDGTDWRELVKGEQGERGPVGPRGPQGPSIDIETGLPISVDTSVGTRVSIGDHTILYDSGRRDITDHVNVDNGWDIGFNPRVNLTRSNLTIELEVMNMSHPDSSGWTTLLRLPSGFRPRSIYYWGYTYRGQQARVTGSGDVQVNSPTTQVDYISLVFLTNTGFIPATLPGTPA